MSGFKDWDKNKRDKSDELLRRGKYRHLLLPHQRQFYDLVAQNNANHYGLYCSRKAGKSFTIMIMAFEFAQNNPGSVQRIILPSKVQSREIYFNIYQELKDIIPPELMPTALKMEAAFQFVNGSRIVLGGALPENQESSRGPIAHRIYRDEVASFNASTYEYFLYSILLPQGTTIPDFKLIDATTPPKSPAHPWIKNEYSKLKSKGNLKTFTIYDNTLLTPAMVESIIDTYGGRTNPNYQREHECKLVADSSLRLTPEFDQAIHVGEIPEPVDNFGNPIVCQPIIGTDIGLADNTYHIFGYHDYILDKYMVVGEWFDTYRTFDQIYDAYKNGVAKHFNADTFLIPDSIVDVWEVARFELRNTHGWNMRAPTKARVDESINFLRDVLVNKKLVISPECVGLINELEVSLWAPNKTEIDRSGDVKHSDGIMALVYALKGVPFGRRPGDAVQLKFKKVSGGRRR